jgi:hypothetical protein
MTEGLASPHAEPADGRVAGAAASGEGGASGAPALPAMPQIPTQAHWVQFGQALDRGPIDPLSTSLPIIASVDENIHPVTRAAQAAADERRARLWSELTTRREPAAPPPADDGELRLSLAQRIAENTVAQDVLNRASQAVARANAVHAVASEKVAELEAAERVCTEDFAREVAKWAAAGADGVEQPQLADPGRANITRIRLATARDGLAAASIARNQLGLKHERAQRTADNAQQQLFAAAKAVISAEARAIADEIERIEQLAGEAFRRLDALAMTPFPVKRGAAALPIQFDPVTTKVALDPPRRGRVDMAPPVRSTTDRATGDAWRAYFAALLADAGAQFDQIEAVEPVAPPVLPSGAFATSRPVSAA